MAHEIEANFTNEWENEESQCQKCNSFKFEDGRCLCSEDNSEISPEAHCDFFKSVD
jgi:hypothetical protein